MFLTTGDVEQLEVFLQRQPSAASRGTRGCPKHPYSFPRNPDRFGGSAGAIQGPKRSVYSARDDRPRADDHRLGLGGFHAGSEVGSIDQTTVDSVRR